MEDESLADDPTYRAGVLMGRQQSVTEVMERLLSETGGDQGERLKSILTRCVQTQEESRTELELVVTALRDEEG